MFTSKRSIHEADMDNSFIHQSVFHAAADSISPLPSGVISNACKRFLADPYKSLAVNCRIADDTNTLKHGLLLLLFNRSKVIFSVYLHGVLQWNLS
jgi:hypothetical protein